MKKSYNVTGSDRKGLVQVIGKAVGTDPVYKGVPTCAYAIGDITVNRNGDMIWDDRTDDATIRKVIDALAMAGYMAQDEEETEEVEQPEVYELEVNYPTSVHTGNSLRNLINLIYARVSLINKALGTSFTVDKGLVDMLSENEGLRTAEDFCKAVKTYSFCARSVAVAVSSG